MELKLKILKAVLMLRKSGNVYSTKAEQIAMFTEWFPQEREQDLDEYIDGLREELNKTPEEIEQESARFREELERRELELMTSETGPDPRDEWDDLWSDRARDCGAIQ